ncbi:NAD+ synthase [Thalassoglobus sp. JC818]|uniref:NAD+ synthase n=1 Tax=Thalassoglobus sp. JC818 TaxID=3232136 RepID=UPI003457C803
MKVTIAQINPIVGDITGNSEKIRQAAQLAKRQGAQLLVTPELAICGYPPKDLLMRGGFVDACDTSVKQLADETSGEFGILVGHPTRPANHSGRPYNAATLLADGGVKQTVHKSLLPNYDVFDEERYFSPGTNPAPMTFLGKRLGVHICEDAWYGEPDTFYHLPPLEREDPVRLLADQGVDLFFNLSASPFEVDKFSRRCRIIRQHVSTHQRPVIFANQVGGNDDLVFDGRSFVLDSNGNLASILNGFQEQIVTVDLNNLDTADPVTDSREKQLFEALTLGLGDYAKKSGFTDCVLGLSGGIDSAVAAAIAAEALGGEHVHALLMPSRFSSDHSLSDAWELARNYKLDAQEIPIDAIHKAYESTVVVGDDLSSAPLGLADQNLQARIRGAMVMTRSNTHGWLPIATGNKSELAVGYCTLYGDMCGGFAALCDVYKQDVYGIARYINEAAGKELIPSNIIDKAPSAELAPDQFDQDSLPPYPVLDAILYGLIEQNRNPAEMVGEFPEETVRWVVQKLDRNEFKRWQIPPGVKVTQTAFGTGRRMPMAARGFTGMK